MTGSGCFAQVRSSVRTDLGETPLAASAPVAIGDWSVGFAGLPAPHVVNQFMGFG
jgi:hypothetical protein